MAVKSYSNVNLPTAFVEEFIDPLLADESLGFTSRADVVSEAVRAFAARGPRPYHRIVRLLKKYRPEVA